MVTVVAASEGLAIAATLPVQLVKENPPLACALMLTMVPEL